MFSPKSVLSVFFERHNYCPPFQSSARLMALGYGQLLVAGGGIKRDAWDRNFGDLAREMGMGEHAGKTGRQYRER